MDRTEEGTAYGWPKYEISPSKPLRKRKRRRKNDEPRLPIAGDDCAQVGVSKSIARNPVIVHRKLVTRISPKSFQDDPIDTPPLSTPRPPSESLSLKAVNSTRRPLFLNLGARKVKPSLHSGSQSSCYQRNLKCLQKSTLEEAAKFQDSKASSLNVSGESMKQAVACKQNSPVTSPEVRPSSTIYVEETPHLNFSPSPIAAMTPFPGQGPSLSEARYPSPASTSYSALKHSAVSRKGPCQAEELSPSNIPECASPGRNVHVNEGTSAKASPSREMGPRYFLRVASGEREGSVPGFLSQHPPLTEVSIHTEESAIAEKQRRCSFPGRRLRYSPNVSEKDEALAKNPATLGPTPHYSLSLKESNSSLSPGILAEHPPLTVVSCQNEDSTNFEKIPAESSAASAKKVGHAMSIIAHDGVLSCLETPDGSENVKVISAKIGLGSERPKSGHNSPVGKRRVQRSVGQEGVNGSMLDNHEMQSPVQNSQSQLGLSERKSSVHRENECKSSPLKRRATMPRKDSVHYSTELIERRKELYVESIDDDSPVKELDNGSFQNDPQKNSSSWENICPIPDTQPVEMLGNSQSCELKLSSSASKRFNSRARSAVNLSIAKRNQRRLANLDGDTSTEPPSPEIHPSRSNDIRAMLERAATEQIDTSDDEIQRQRRASRIVRRNIPCGALVSRSVSCSETDEP